MKNRSKITGIILLIIGIVLIFWPLSTLAGLCKLIGVCLIIGGALELVLGLAGENKSASNIIIGAIAIIVGIIFVISPGFVITLLPRIIGIITAAGGLIFLIRALVKKEKGPADVAEIVGGAVALVVGIVLIFYAASAVRLLMIVMGIFLVYFGVMSLVGKKD